MSESIKWTTEMEELLIDLIKSRPCLWNRRRLPPPEKTAEKIKISWDEVYKTVGETFNIDFRKYDYFSIFKRWGVLVDYFFHKQKQASTGSGDEEVWKHEKRMMFLKDTLTGPVDDNEKNDEKKLEKIDKKPSKRKRTESETIVSMESDDQVENKPTLLNSILNAIELTMTQFPQNVLQDTLFKIYATVDEARRNIQNTKKN